MFFAYLKFLLNSKNQHGVHSPFVFDFLTKGLYVNPHSSELKKIESIRKSLLINNHEIEINDFGAGSKIFKTNKRKVSDLAKYVALSPKKAVILFKIIRYYKPEKILELGTSLGLGTSTLAYAHPDAQITTIEGCSNLVNEAQNLFNSLQLHQISCQLSTFKDFIKTNKKSFDFILFDGNHTYEATINYFEKLLPTSHNASVWLFDDIYWSKEMEQAWTFIKNHEAVTVTIDLFYYGLVFFRKEQVKQHFKIRP